MKTYKCEYGRYIDGNLVAEKIQAESHREAYEKFLANQGVFPEAVVVTSGFMDGGTIFNDHIEKTREELADSQAIAIKQTATEDAEASLTSTDMLLKQLIAKQDETNQWLLKIRRALISIFIIIAMWHLFGWRIIPIR